MKTKTNQDMNEDLDFLFLDTETTGIEAEDRLCQVAFLFGGMSRDRLFKPPVWIKTAAMAVHHITNQMVDEAPPFRGSKEHGILEALAPSVILVAHNARFDIGMLAKEGISFGKWIDTLKLARFLDERDELESHSLQFLRYHYSIEEKAQAHDAVGDVLVLKRLFSILCAQLMARKGLDEKAVVEEMLRISRQSEIIRRFRFGKYKGRLVEEIVREDRAYLEWLLGEKRKSPEGDEDWIKTLEHFLGIA